MKKRGPKTVSSDTPVFRSWIDEEEPARVIKAETEESQVNLDSYKTHNEYVSKRNE